MRRILLVLLALASGVWAAPGWAPFSPADHSFTVAFPEPPTMQTEGPPTWLWSSGSGAGHPVYLLGYYQVPLDEEKQGKEFFDAYVQLMCNTFGLTEQKRSPFSTEGTVGYDIEGANKRGRPTHVHVLHRKPQHRFYFLLTVGDADPKTYFTSLRL